jgi:hypothetical protein
MEETHIHVRENVEGAMHRQKKYYDQKLSWQSFQPDDQVLVLILWIFLSYPIYMYYLWFTFSTTVNFVSDICDFYSGLRNILPR